MVFNLHILIINIKKNFIKNKLILHSKYYLYKLAKKINKKKYFNFYNNLKNIINKIIIHY